MADEPLPEGLARVLGEYERHLRSERDLTAHTVTAYTADIAGLFEHAARLGITEAADLDLRTLRSWLAKQQTVGRSRTTLARRATAARVFTAWLTRTGRAGSDVGASLGSPKPHRTLPAVLRADEARALIDAATALADDGSPVGLRDVAMLEVLYATGIRVGELVGLDVDDIDRDRNVLRVFGKGRKERTVPFGRPAAHALDFWLRHGRPALVVEGAGAALFLGARGRRIDQRAVRRLVHQRLAECRVRRTWARTACGTRPPPTSWRVERTCARCRSCWGTPRWPPPSATRTSPPKGCEGPTSRRTHGRDAGPDGIVSPQWQQPHRAGTDQPQRVEVGVAADPAPVQASTWEAVGSRQLKGADPVAGGQSVADRHRCRHRLVRRAGRPVVDDHDASARERRGVGHRARQGGAHRLTGQAGEVDAPVARAIGGVGRVEAVDYVGFR